MTIRTRPATQEYRDNWPFPEPDSPWDLDEAAANSVERSDMQCQIPEIGARVLVRTPCEGTLHGLFEWMAGEVVCVQKRTLTVRLENSQISVRTWTFFIRSDAWKPVETE